MKAAKINQTMALENPLKPQLIAAADVVGTTLPAFSTTGMPTRNNTAKVMAINPINAGGIGSKISPTTKPAFFQLL